MWFKQKTTNNKQKFSTDSCQNQLASIQSNGVDLDIKELLYYQNKTALIDLSARKNIHGQMSGNYLSRSKGRGMEFDEVRHYQTGDDIRAIEVSGNSALYKGDYKILRSILPVGDGKWRLFNLADDPGETNDLSDEQPQKLQNMLAHYADYAAKMDVLDMPEGYDSTKQIRKNAVKRMRARYGKFILLMGFLGLMGVLSLVGIVRRKRKKAEAEV